MPVVAGGLVSSIRQKLTALIHFWWLLKHTCSFFWDDRKVKVVCTKRSLSSQTTYFCSTVRPKISPKIAILKSPPIPRTPTLVCRFLWTRNRELHQRFSLEKYRASVDLSFVHTEYLQPIYGKFVPFWRGRHRLFPVRLLVFFLIQKTGHLIFTISIMNLLSEHLEYIHPRTADENSHRSEVTTENCRNLPKVFKIRWSNCNVYQEVKIYTSVYTSI